MYEWIALRKVSYRLTTTTHALCLTSSIHWQLSCARPLNFWHTGTTCWASHTCRSVHGIKLQCSGIICITYSFNLPYPLLMLYASMLASVHPMIFRFLHVGMAHLGCMNETDQQAGLRNQIICWKYAVVCLLFAVIPHPFNEYFCESFTHSVQEWSTLFFSDMSILVTIGESSGQQQFY